MTSLWRDVRRVVIPLAVAVVMTGCIEKDTETTVAIEPDGSGTWTVLYRDVRSDASTRGERTSEERGFLAKVEAGRHDAALALDAVGCQDVDTRVVRGGWPYMILTEGRFSDLAAVWKRLLDLSGIPGESAIERVGDRITWRLRADTRDDRQADAEEDDAKPLETLLLSSEEPRFFLERGRFVDATGFVLADDGRVATMKPIEDESLEKAGGILVLTLTWTTESARQGGGSEK